MAEVTAGFASVASVTSLVDVCCRLIVTIYKTAITIKNASQSIQRLSQRTESLRELLNLVDWVYKQTPTSSIAINDGFSVQAIQAIQNALEACHGELVDIEGFIAALRSNSGKMQDLRRGIKWVIDKSKIEQYCRNIEVLSDRITMSLSLAGRCNDISIKDDILRLRAHVSDTHSSLATSMDMLQAHSRDANLVHRRNQEEINGQLQKLNQGKEEMNAILLKLSSLQLEYRHIDLDVASPQYSGLEAMAYPLLNMRTILIGAMFSLSSYCSDKISNEEIDFLVDEYERLAAFCKTNSDLENHELGNSRPRQRYGNGQLSIHDSFTINVDYASILKNVSRTKKRRTVFTNRTGRLEVQFEERVGHFQNRPSTIQYASFRYLPDTTNHVNSNSIYASFQKLVQMNRKPYVTRILREVRNIHGGEIYDQLTTALKQDDILTVQRMLSFGKIRPWDRYRDATGSHGYEASRTLIELATSFLAFKIDGYKVLQYLLQGTWDIENSHGIQFLLWSMAPHEPYGAFEKYFNIRSHASATANELGQTFDENFVSECFYPLACYERNQFSEYRNVRKTMDFFLSHGIDLEAKNTTQEDTMLLSVARANNPNSALWMRALLESGANITAVDKEGNGALHLTLYLRKQSGRGNRAYESMMEKLLLLLRAGCSIYNTDYKGRTPEELAGQSPRKARLWMDALQEVGMVQAPIEVSELESANLPTVHEDSEISDPAASEDTINWGLNAEIVTLGQHHIWI